MHIKRPIHMLIAVATIVLKELFVSKGVETCTKRRGDCGNGAAGRFQTIKQEDLS